MKLYTIRTFLLDLVFPKRCLGCQKELKVKDAFFICGACFEKIALNSGIRCHICGLRNKKGTCRRCRKKTPLTGLFAAGPYQDQILKEMIHRFKYQSIESLKKPLAQLIINYLEKELLNNKLKNYVLTPIPLSLRRKINRGFNQSELLAVEISKYLNLPVVNLLKRKKFTAPQAKITDWKQRKENISGAFILSPSYPLFTRCRTPDKINEVILVDDVVTSGATLEEAARVLKQAGVKKVYGLVIAKG